MALLNFFNALNNMLPSQDERLFVESPDKIRIVLGCMPGPWVGYLLGDVPYNNTRQTQK